MTKYIFILVLALASLACGVSNTAAIANSQPEPLQAVSTSANAVSMAVDRLPASPYTDGRLLTVTADVLTVRSCGNTDNAICPALGYAYAGDVLTALGGNVWTGGNDCPQWLEVEYQSSPAWVCAAFVTPE
jgi:hypothetical protein